MVVVRVYYSIKCPVCKRFMRTLEKLEVNDLGRDPHWFFDGNSGAKVPNGITVIPVPVDGDFELTANSPPSGRCMSSRWLQKYGKTELQKELAKKGQVVDMLGGNPVPCMVISYFDGRTTQDIVIVGGVRKEKEEEFLKNMKSLIYSVAKIEERAMMSGVPKPLKWEGF